MTTRHVIEVGQGQRHVLQKIVWEVAVVRCELSGSNDAEAEYRRVLRENPLLMVALTGRIPVDAPRKENADA